MLGHTNIQMTLKYLAVAQSHIEAQHRQFQPWRSAQDEETLCKGHDVVRTGMRHNARMGAYEVR
jgi:hypothetical protein